MVQYTAVSPWPRLLSDFSPVPGRIKLRYADFVVEEIPLYPAAGAGSHTYFLVEKTGLSTLQAIEEVARVLNVRRRDIGFAGLKDARAVTRQWMSIEHVAPERLANLVLPRLRVLSVTCHHNKLRLGHLRANRFSIKVRETQPQRLDDLRQALLELCRRGVPNYFGTQRFGYRGDTWRVGRALLHGEPTEALDIILGQPTAADRPAIRRARELYQRRQYAEAARAWPVLFRTERRALRALHRTSGSARAGLAAIDKRTQQFYVAAYQSRVFNEVLAARLPLGLGRLWDGDLAWVHRSGAVFHIASAAAEQARADRFEISPTGPIVGDRMSQPTGRAAELEARICLAAGTDRLSAERPAGTKRARVRARGGRRALRFQPEAAEVSLGADEGGPYLELGFVLPRGCYATALLGELFSTPGASVAGHEADS